MVKEENRQDSRSKQVMIKLNGNDGNDLLSGGNGNDELTGGKGADKFDCGAGKDKITDFNPSECDIKSTDCEQ